MNQQNRSKANAPGRLLIYMKFTDLRETTPFF